MKKWQIGINWHRSLLASFAGNPRVLWDYLKHKIRHETIVYSKRKVRDRRGKQTNLEERLKEYYCLNKCDKYPTADNLNDLDILQAKNMTSLRIHNPGSNY